MKIERKTVGFEVKEIDEEEGTFTGYASTFRNHPDSYGEIVDPGAFKKTIKERKQQIKILWNHDTYEPIGRPTELSEDDIGLLFNGKLSLGVQRAREVLSLMKDGVINEMSIGFNVIKEKMVDNVRHLTEIKLYDISPVSFAADSDAVITGVKDDSQVPDYVIDLKVGDLDQDKIKAAIETLQALQIPVEPDESTQEDQEAARLEASIAELKARADGFNTRDAEQRIAAILEKIN